jgi:hypothetical protein
MPARVGEIVSVGEFSEFALADGSGSAALASPKSSTFTTASGVILTFRLQIAMDDPALMRIFQRLGDLLRIVQRRLQRQRAVERLTLDQLHDQRTLFHSVDGRNIGMIERRQYLGFALEARHAVGVLCEGLG